MVKLIGKRNQAHPLVLRNAKCVDFASRRLNTSTLLIEKGTISKKVTGRGLRIEGGIEHDLKGRYVIPGFIDAHTHLIPEGIDMQRIDLSRCRSLDDCLQKVTANLKSAEIAFASKWDDASWRTNEMEALTRRTLDKVSRTKPIIMRRICGHYAVVNTPAMKYIPPHWKIVDRKNGRLYEDVALNLNDIFRPTAEMLANAVRLATEKAVRLGITSVHEISKPRYLQALLKEREKAALRFSVYLTRKYHNHIVQTGLRAGFGDDWIRFAGTKVFVDGSVGARTAALKDPFQRTRKRGKMLVSKSRLKRLVSSAEESGFQLMIHSIGDRATEEVLSVLRSQVPKGNPLRHRIEHLELLSDESIDTLAKIGLIASMQPNFVRCWQNPGGFYERVMGPRYQRMNCYKTLLNRNIKVIFGSDCMPMGPLYGLYGAVAHPFDCGRLDVACAFRLYTEAGAYATFEEKKKGKLLPGYFADLVVLDRNPLDEENLSAMKIDAVMVGGVFKYRRNAPPSA
ncbi:MAG: amidohydrolase family protein [candidate division WOR-3 bacterium]|nr:MAG: amidohydrolase family protein [candidate division WOR-3 bacterium]